MPPLTPFQYPHGSFNTPIENVQAQIEILPPNPTGYVPNPTGYAANIKKLGWAKHLRTRKHSENEKGVEEVEKKQCRKCGCGRVLKLYRGENATCNICLGYRESWAGKNPEKVRDMNRNYWAEHREEKKVYNKEYSQREIECEVCECRVRTCNWARHLGTRKHMFGGGKVDGDVGGGGG